MDRSAFSENPCACTALQQLAALSEELQDVAPGLATALTAPALIAYAQGALLNGRSAEQLQTALDGESVRVELPSVGDLLRQAQEDLVAGKPSGPVLGLAGLAGYVLLSCFLCASPPRPPEHFALVGDLNQVTLQARSVQEKEG